MNSVVYSGSISCNICLFQTDILGRCKVDVTQSQLGDETIVLKKRDMDKCDNRLTQTLLMPSPVRVIDYHVCMKMVS